MLAILLVFLLPLLFPSSLSAQSLGSFAEVMAAANRHYEDARYDQAVADYKTILAAGIRNSDVYYNLGNAYYRQRDLGRAILNYRRAQWLEPRDADISANLRLARVQTVDRLDISGTAQAGFGQIVGRWFTLDEISFLLLALWLLICLCLSLAILVPRYRRLWRWLIAACTVLLLVGLVTVVSHVYTRQQFPEAVVVAPKIDATSGPGPTDQYAVEFTLHAGAEVNLLERRLGWRRVALPGDLQGWVPAEAVELVIDEGN